MLLRENDINNKYYLPVMPQEKTKDKSSGNSFYDSLLNKAKKLRNVAGALYIVAESLPFDVVNLNYKKVPYNSKTSKELGATSIIPYARPIIYNHSDGSHSDEAPNIVGRMLAWGIQDNGRGTKSLYTAQAIIDKNTIERINNLLDYTQSITYRANTYVCDLCGALHPQTICDHYPGDIIEDGSQGEPKRVTFSMHANRIMEQSFVLKPAYDDTVIVAQEQNSVNGGKGKFGQAIIEYNNKVAIVVPDTKLKDLNGKTLDTTNNSQENNDIINKSGNTTSEPSTDGEDKQTKQQGENSMKSNENTINALEGLLATLKDAGSDATETTQPNEQQNASNANENVDKLAGTIDAVLEQNKALIEQNQQLSTTVINALVGALTTTKIEPTNENTDTKNSTSDSETNKDKPEDQTKNADTEKNKDNNSDTENKSDKTENANDEEENKDKTDENEKPNTKSSISINQSVLAKSFLRSAGYEVGTKKENK